MLAIELQFPAGRYHATPWDRHVNEGSVEWPPSPWRLLRAFIATWHRKVTDLPEAVVRSLVVKLADVTPEYALPEFVGAHTRHYVPSYSGNTTKVFDTFLHVTPGGTIHVHWPGAELTAEESSAFDRILSALGYLGRAESWVEAKQILAPRTATVTPVANATDPRASSLISVLAPLPQATYITWRDQQIAKDESDVLHQRQRAAKAKGKPMPTKLSPKERATVAARLPEDTFVALQCDIGDLRRDGWSQPPASQWLQYRRLDPPARVPRRVIEHTATSALPTVARVLVVSKVPPRLVDAVHLTERLRGRLLRGKLAVFGGKDEIGEPRRGHDHAFLLPEANGRGPGHITHVTIYAPMGFDDAARDVLNDLRLTPGRHEDPTATQFVLLGVGHPEDFAGRRIDAGQCPLLDSSVTWISRTPFVPTRHPKSTRDGTPKLDQQGLQIGAPEHDLRRLLQDALGLPPPVSVEAREETMLGGKPTRWRSFSLQRRCGEGTRAGFTGYGFRITFAEPVRGPIAVGYGAHFGLGGFVPEEPAQDTCM